MSTDNTDLVGQRYRNGPGGFTYEVVRVCPDDPDFVISDRVADRAPVTALASLVRAAIEDLQAESGGTR